MSRENDVLSAYLDGEVDSTTARMVEARLLEDEGFRRTYESYLRIREAINEEEEPDYNAASARVWEHIERTRESVERERPAIWRKRLSIPLPLAAAAALLFFAMAGISIYFATEGESRAPTALAGINPSELDITIQIDNEQARELIRWLEEREDVQQVNIELPETPRFELIGEPVLVPASDARGQSR